MNSVTKAREGADLFAALADRDPSLCLYETDCFFYGHLMESDEVTDHDHRTARNTRIAVDVDPFASGDLLMDKADPFFEVFMCNRGAIRGR